MVQDELSLIEAVVHRHPDGIAVGAIGGELAVPPPRRTLQYRLKRLVDSGRVLQTGRGRGVLYAPSLPADVFVASEHGRYDSVTQNFPASLLAYRDRLARKYLSVPASQRQPARFRPEFLRAYRPNTPGGYLTPAERKLLGGIGRRHAAPQPAGTHARRILDRMMIDLSWNSSRLEGNTYSLLDTKRLIELGDAANGRNALETQMILNHKQAIEFLVDGADQIGFDRPTILNLHALLADNLLPNQSAIGRLRSIPVGIGRSAFRPLDIPAQIEEHFHRLLQTAGAIDDPFEQALFCLIQFPYLQAFEDVNKRVSRLAANIPLIRHNLSPLCFSDVPRDCYTDAVLLIYEQNETGLMRQLFIWAYARSAAQYGAVRQTLGEPDPFRLRHRDALRTLVGQVVREGLNMRSAARLIEQSAAEQVAPGDRDRFREYAERELISLHEGNYARYRVTLSQFQQWHNAWHER